MCRSTEMNVHAPIVAVLLLGGQDDSYEPGGGPDGF